MTYIRIVVSFFDTLVWTKRWKWGR